MLTFRPSAVQRKSGSSSLCHAGLFFIKSCHHSTMEFPQLRLGALAQAGGGCRFLVWAPRTDRLEVYLPGRDLAYAMRPEPDGYFSLELPGLPPGTRYFYQFPDGRRRPDPASRRQPEGVHGASEVIAVPSLPEFGGWHGLPREALVFYELHVGAFTPEGTLRAIEPRLDALCDLGITALELMPLHQYPGQRNWGYDGAQLFALQANYGTPADLRSLITAAHARGLAVFLDVVYNHLGPEGNYLGEFGPYFTDHYRTPWGQAVNFDGGGSDEVRRFFYENALYWLRDYGCDGLRLDAIHGIVDNSASPFLAELTELAQAEGGKSGRRIKVIAESSLNDTRVLRPRAQGGFGMDAQWNDDFHHSLHTALTGEAGGYYQDFQGATDLATAYNEGFVYQGQHSAYRGRRHGNASREWPAASFVIFSQNHDQVGNRAGSERLSTLTGFEAQKLAAVALLCAPQLPLLFMGEEYGEPAPFYYFIEHGDPELIAAVRRGRREEFHSFRWQKTPADPQAWETFAASRLDWSRRDREPHATLLRWHRELLRLRREVPALGANGGARAEVLAGGKLLRLLRTPAKLISDIGLPVKSSEPPVPSAMVWLHFGQEPLNFEWPDAEPWQLILDSADQKWGGPKILDKHGHSSQFVFSPNSAMVLLRK